LRKSHFFAFWGQTDEHMDSINELSRSRERRIKNVLFSKAKAI